MPALPIKKSTTDNVIGLRIVDGKTAKNKVRYKNDGSIDKRHNNHGNKASGVSSEVYPFYSEAEIECMIDVFNKRIDNAPDENKRQIACRNKMLFIVGVNLGLRASDLARLTYSFFINEDGTFKDFYTLKPKKTEKTGKFVKLYFNEAVKKAITNYIDEYPLFEMDEFLFKSRVGDSHIKEITLGKIIKKAAEEVGIDRPINSHSLRKTFGRFVFHNAVDKNHALVLLQTIFNHTSPSITAKYIGITDDEISDVFNTLNIGIDFM